MPQGLALHNSMQRHIKQYTLWILCVDDIVHEALQKLALPNVRLLRLSQLETVDLLRVKSKRTNGEYCWTLTPFAPRFVFEADPLIARVTYVDADIWFRKDPSAIFRELEASGKSVLITDHGYAPEYDQSATSGQYCVQFIVFERIAGETVRRWWEERCIEWCYARVENGKFGDQKYLDEWPVLFDDVVHVLTHKEWTQAPWNATRFPYGDSIFYHFQGLRFISKNQINLGQAYILPKVLLTGIYAPYIADLERIINTMKQYNLEVLSQEREMSFLTKIRFYLAGVHRQFWRFKAINIIAIK
ncbi:MAG: glycosyl transferase [Candidatus Methylopumilus sp.]|nr:glycosyl transferase [Candidatus Methylopumilus sp.]